MNKLLLILIFSLLFGEVTGTGRKKNVLLATEWITLHVVFQVERIEGFDSFFTVMGTLSFK